MDALMKHAVVGEGEGGYVNMQHPSSESEHKSKERKKRKRIAKSTIHEQVMPHTLGPQEVRTTMECVDRHPCEPPWNKSQQVDHKCENEKAVTRQALCSREVSLEAL